MTSLTLVAVGLAVLAMRRPGRWPLCLALAGLAPAGVALVVGGIGLPVFYFVALFAAMSSMAGLTGLSRTRPIAFFGIPGARPLLAFGVLATMVTLAAPAVFPGMSVLGSDGTGRIMLIPGLVTSSNVAQVTYLWVGLAVIVLVASASRKHPYLVGVTALGIVGLSFCKYVFGRAGLPFPVDLFDNNPVWVHIETAPDGGERFRGILSEPSALANYCLAAAAFSLAAIPMVSPVKRIALLGAFGISVWLGIESTSTTFVVAGCLLCVLATGSFAASVLRPDRAVTSARLVGALSVIVVGYVAAAPLLGYVHDAVTAKSDSDSYSERSGVDSFSVQVARESLGIGVGLGSNRPSSFALMLLSNVGVFGLVLFVVAVVTIVRHSRESEQAGPTRWVLVAILAAKIVSGPDLADSSGLLYITLGVLASLHRPQAHASLHRHSHQSSDRMVSHA